MIEEKLKEFALRHGVYEIKYTGFTWYIADLSKYGTVNCIIDEDFDTLEAALDYVIKETE